MDFVGLASTDARAYTPAVAALPAPMAASGVHAPAELVLPIAEAAAAIPGLQVVFLFGSRLTGRVWPESDLDLGVRWDPGLCRESRHAAERRLLDALSQRLGGLGERVDLVDLDQAASGVAFRAVRDGVCVWAARDQDRVNAVVRVARRYDDEAPLRKLYRQAARRAFGG
jgi:predicted nucleotidyltransferase